MSFFIVFAAHAGLARVGVVPPGVVRLLPLGVQHWFITHQDQEIVPGGFGVTVFFFLSGFLITTLMRLEHDKTGTVSLKAFYLRRVLRILPPFYLVLVLADLLAVLHLLPGTLQPRPVLAQFFHYSNYWFAYHGYNGAAAGTVVYWSLAVEEHFYLLFPLAFLALRRLGLSGRSQGLALWAACALICIWRCVLILHFHVPDDRTYLASDTRFDSILFGCALAVSINPVVDGRVGSDQLWKHVLFPAGLCLLLFSFLYRAPWFRETIRYTIQGIGLTPIFVSAMRFPEWAPFRWLNRKRIAFVGVLSYSLYLVHQVALYATVHQLGTGSFLRTIAGALLALALSFAVALAIYRFVEKPCARLRKRFGGA